MPPSSKKRLNLKYCQPAARHLLHLPIDEQAHARSRTANMREQHIAKFVVTFSARVAYVFSFDFRVFQRERR